MTNKNIHIAIVGAGASGMMAAITAARLGARVTLLERGERVGKKLLATGNGRCNMANVNCSPENYQGENSHFVEPVLRQFPVRKTLGFFNELGVLTKVEEEGRVFPLTGQASTVLDVLRYEVTRCGVEVQTESYVKQIAQEGAAFILRGPQIELHADRVIVATGGKASPQLGGTESCIDLLKKMGHSIVPVFPALVPLKTNPRVCRQLKGVKVIARGRLDVAGKHLGNQLGSQEGEYLFAEYGLSGPPVIQFSQSVNRALLQHQTVSLALDLFPDWNMEQLIHELDKRISSRSETPLDFALVGLMHKRLIPIVLQEAKIAQLHKPAGDVSREEVAGIVNVLKGWQFELTGSLSWNDAQVMAGGVSTKDFDPDTLESRIVKGLFAAGEVLDVTGDCGGYNLQWAWSSGYVAGVNAAKE